MNQLDQIEYHAHEMLKIVAELRRQQNIVVLEVESALQECLRIVSHRTGIQPREILSHTRTQKLCDARNILWWLLVNVHGYTQRRAAFMTGKRCHATAIHGLGTLRNLMSVDAKVKALVELCEADAQKMIQARRVA